MIPAAFDYVRAGSADEAVTLLVEHGDDAKLLAGGHSLLPLMKLRLATPAVLVDVGRVQRPLLHPRRRRPHRDRRAHAPPRPGDLRASSSSTCRSSSTSPTSSAIPQVRHRGTLGGTLAHGDAGVRPPGGRPRARRHARRTRARRRAGDRGHRLLPELPRDRAPRPTSSSPRSACPRSAAPAGRTRSSTGEPRTGRSSASPRCATAPPASRS